MNCLYCNGSTIVIDTRPTKSGIRRRRKCLDCGERFTTIETAKGQSFDALSSAVNEVSKLKVRCDEVIKKLAEARSLK